MAQVIECPGCRRRLLLPADLSGRLVQCPRCAQTFQPRPTDEEPPLVVPVEPEEGGARPQVDTAPGAAGPLDLSLDSAAGPRRAAVPSPPRPLRPVPVAALAPDVAVPDDIAPFFCPGCGERVPSAAERCRLCGEYLHPDDADESPGMRRDLEPHRGGLILTLGILSLAGLSFCGLGLPFGIAAWALGQADIHKMDAHRMDPQGRGTTNAGRVCGIVGTILDSLILCLTGMAFLSH